MKLATSRCKNPACRELYDVEVEDRIRFIRCPVCSQVNDIDDRTSEITGRCTKCKRAIDDHRNGHCP